MKVEIKSGYLKDLKAVPKYIRQQAEEVIKTLEKTDSLYNSGLDYLELKGKQNKGFYRIRIGTYRIGCYCEQPDIAVITILKRGEFYLKFP